MKFEMHIVFCGSFMFMKISSIVNDTVMALFIKLVIGDATFDYAGGAITSCRS
jgi:hypothetical protein